MYSGFAESYFARPAVRALRAHMVRRVLAVTGPGRASRVLSLGSGIGDTELLLAPHVADVKGIRSRVVPEQVALDQVPIPAGSALL